ncbi:MAG: mannose-6-phosphate isomerase, class I, partial [Deltaproteobacteria bacterium]|nr:mannose-6-phosphate isomerase, class I [Deltaproteobacteria bacterium]
MNQIQILENSILNYSWGSKRFISGLFGNTGSSDEPEAELWMGAHPKAPSYAVVKGSRLSLADLIERDPKAVLGATVAERFSGKLPFLFKVLAAARPLSIQTHPSMKQAGEGFAMEQAGKIPLDALNRNYRDDNHKPELLCALTEMWALKGFRRVEEIIDLMGQINTACHGLGVDILRQNPGNAGLKMFFNYIMSMGKGEQARLVGDVMAVIEGLNNSDNTFDWMKKLNQEYPGDIGVISPLFLNVVLLKPGEALYIPAGELHAYLDGAGIEIMANSDNVLRGGLTPKHVDPTELLKILSFVPDCPEILTPVDQDSMESVYLSEAKEFILSVIYLNKGKIYKSPAARNVEIIICTKGKA